jgi:hypothetical protein
MKSAAHELKGSRAYVSASQRPEAKCSELRTPLLSVVDYRGFRSECRVCVCVASAPRL